MDSRFSFAPLGEPGRVMMRDLSRTPATGRDMMATSFLSAIPYFLESSADLVVLDLQGVTASEEASIP